MALQGPLLFYVFTTLITVCTRQPLTTALSTSTEVQSVDTVHGMRTNGTLFAWSTWGAWGACSRTCGGGVAVQERQCLPRDPTRWRRSRKRRKLTRSVDLGRRSRNVITRPEPDCAGLGRRYHECNNAPCPGSKRDSRAEQCAVYDRRPFRGRFYTWVPYVDGNAPCILNCRPRGQQFYASLALVADGTPCTKPGFRAICVQGSCKILDCNPTQKESSRGGHVMCPVKCNAIHVVQFCVTLINRKAVDGAQRETATVFTEPA